MLLVAERRDGIDPSESESFASLLAELLVYARRTADILDAAELVRLGREHHLIASDAAFLILAK